MKSIGRASPRTGERMKYSILAVATALMSGLAWSQESPDVTSMTLPELNVTAGTPNPGNPLFQASDIDVLSGREKERSESATLGETLEQFTGVQNLGTGNQVGKPVIRGLSGNRVRILSDGVGVDHQQFGTRHSPNVDPFLSDRIEVVRGASSLLYGSGALGGAIDVQPLGLGFSEDGQRHNRGQTLSGYFSNNDQKNFGAKVFSEGPVWSFNAAIVDRSAEDVETPDDTVFLDGNVRPPDLPAGREDLRKLPLFTGELEFTDFDQTNGQAGVGYRGDFGDVFLRYTGWRNEHNFLLPPPAVQRPPGSAPVGLGQNLENDEVQLKALLEPASGWELEPIISWQNNLRESNAAGAPRSELFDGTIDVEFDQYSGRLEARHQALGPFDAGTLGVEVSHRDQDSRGTTQLTPGGEVTNAALFAFEERTLGRLTLQSGLRFDWHETIRDEDKTRAETKFDDDLGDRDKNQYQVFTGSLGGTYSLTPNLVLAANLARGFRAPGLFELYGDGRHGGVAARQQGKPDLDEETNINTDLGLRWESQGLSARATVFRNSIDDFIFLVDTGRTDGPGDEGLPIFNFEQDDATLRGVELEATGQISPELEVGASYSLVDSENDATDEDLPLQPADEFRGEITWSPNDWTTLSDPYLTFQVRHKADKDAAPREPFVQFDGAPFGSASTDSYTVADLSAGFGLASPLGPPARVDLEIRNLTDRSFRDFLDTYKGYALSPGRDFRLTLRVPFET